MRYFEDLQPGDVVMGSTFVVERDEMVEFARRWDPQPFHLDDAVANELFGEGGVTAPGVFIMAVRTRLLHDEPDPVAVIAALGYNALRFLAPVSRAYPASSTNSPSRVVAWRREPLTVSVAHRSRPLSRSTPR